MSVIKRIEIRNFRSIHHLIIDEGLKDLNVFVGNNDIGKSNILRALNLFFNGTTDVGKTLNFWEDFNKNIERKSGKGQYIKITLDINLKYENNKFIRWTRQWNNQGIRTTNSQEIFQSDGTPTDFSPSSRAPGWLERMTFRYIPAVKGPLYFQHLFEELHDLLNTSYSEQFKSNTQSLIKSIQTITSDITEELSNSLNLKNKISLPTDLKLFFGSLDFSLESNGNTFNLSARGDGIKVRHIPVVLKFLAQKAKANKRGALDVQTIWGFEEPENNLEMSHAFALAKTFVKYSDDIQIFLTTHSPAFYSLRKNDQKVSCWFVDRDENNSTFPTNVVDHSIDIDDKMGILAYITPFVEEKNIELLKEKEERKKLIQQLETFNPTSKCIIFTEDSAGELQMIKSLAESNGFVLNETMFYSYDGKDNLKNIIYASKWLIQEKFKNVEQIIFHRDRDVDGDQVKERLLKKLPPNYHLYITNGYDLDTVFLNKEHIKSLYPEIELSVLEQKINESIEATKDKSIQKIKDGLFQMYIDAGRINRTHSPSKLEKEAKQLYDSDPIRYCYGKTVLGNLKGRLQHSTTSKSFDVFNPSTYLEIENLKEISSKIWK